MVKFIDYIIETESPTSVGYYVAGYVEKGWFGKETKFYYTYCTASTTIRKAMRFNHLDKAKFFLGIPHIQKNVWIGDNDG